MMYSLFGKSDGFVMMILFDFLKETGGEIFKMVIIPWLELFVISIFTVIMLTTYKKQNCGIIWCTWIPLPNTLLSVLCQRFVAPLAISKHIYGGLIKRCCWWNITVTARDNVMWLWFIVGSFKHGRFQWVIVLSLSCRVSVRFIRFLFWVVGNNNNLFIQIFRLWDPGISSMIAKMLATNRKPCLQGDLILIYGTRHHGSKNKAFSESNADFTCDKVFGVFIDLRITKN